jgi:hypothetical protein
MVKDLRYESVKTMIETGGITEFKEIFLILPKSNIAKAIHTNNNRMTDLINYAGKITIDEIHMIAGLLGIDFNKITAIITNQYLKDKKVVNTGKEGYKSTESNTNKNSNKTRKKK